MADLKSTRDLIAASQETRVEGEGRVEGLTRTSLALAFAESARQTILLLTSHKRWADTPLVMPEETDAWRLNQKSCKGRWT